MENKDYQKKFLVISNEGEVLYETEQLARALKFANDLQFDKKTPSRIFRRRNIINLRAYWYEFKYGVRVGGGFEFNKIGPVGAV